MPELVKLMKQTNAFVPVRALMVVDSAGVAGIPALLDVLTNRHAYSQVSYLEGCMGQLGTDGHYAVPPLLNCLTNGNWGVAVVAARWLGRIRADRELVVPALMTCLDGPDARVRCAAVQALGEFRG
jgi:HEAT repeat protein